MTDAARLTPTEKGIEEMKITHRAVARIAVPATVTVYDLRYSQNGCDAADGPSLVTLLAEPRPADVPSDCVVVPMDVSEDLAFEIAE